MFQENPHDSGVDAGRGRWEHHLTRLDPERRVLVGEPDATFASRLVGSAWVLPRIGCQSVSADTRGRVLVPAGVAWHLGLVDTAVVSVRDDGLVVIRAGGVLDPTASEVTAWTA